MPNPRDPTGEAPLELTWVGLMGIPGDAVVGEEWAHIKCPGVCHAGEVHRGEWVMSEIEGKIRPAVNEEQRALLFAGDPEKREEEAFSEREGGKNPSSSCSTPPPLVGSSWKIGDRTAVFDAAARSALLPRLRTILSG